MAQPPSSEPEAGEPEVEPGEPEVEPGNPAVAQPGRTGHPDVDAALDRLADVDALPVAEHVEVYDDVQQRLGAAMDDASDAQPPPGRG